MIFSLTGNLSKFGQLEASRSGLTDAFVAAIGHDAAVLTAVSPAYREAWEAFKAPLSTILQPDEHALDAWWNRIRR